MFKKGNDKKTQKTKGKKHAKGVLEHEIKFKGYENYLKASMLENAINFLEESNDDIDELQKFNYKFLRKSDKILK